jgi:hypothetical protein
MIPEGITGKLGKNTFIILYYAKESNRMENVKRYKNVYDITLCKISVYKNLYYVLCLF